MLFRKGVHVSIKILNTHKPIDGRLLLVNIRYERQRFFFRHVPICGMNWE